MENYLYSLTYQLIEGVVEEQSENLMVTEEQKKFIADFYKYSFVGVMLDWIKRGMKEAPEEIANMVCVTMHGNVGNPCGIWRRKAIKIKFVRKIRDNYGIAALILKERDIKFSKSTLQSKADDKFFVIPSCFVN